MFSLHKNYVLEQNGLINELQNKLVQQNIELAKLKVNLGNLNSLIPYFKKISQVLTNYYVDNNAAKTNVIADLILFILDYINTHNNKVITENDVKQIEQKIDEWEQEIIKLKNSTPKSVVDVTEKVSVDESSEKQLPDKTKKVVQKFSGLLLVETDN